MQICVTGSIATDHLMTFDGRFADLIVADKLETVSLSFLVDDLMVRRGGTGANIAFGLGLLGLQPILLGAVGGDFDDYRSWLSRHGVDCTSVHVVADKHTARFICTTDTTGNQIASFYAGAMSDAREIEVGPVVDRHGTLDLVVISPNDPAAMIRHTQECRDRGIRFVADPSQQLAIMDGPDIASLIEDAHILFSNEYEAALIAKKTGWSDQDILDRVGQWVMTRSEHGSVIRERGVDDIAVPAVTVERVADPTGVGDAFRSGYLAGVAWGWNSTESAQLGSVVASLVLEHAGTQEHTLEPDTIVERWGRTYPDSPVESLRERTRSTA